MASSALISGCGRPKHEVPEQLPSAPRVAPSIEPQAQDEAARCPVPAEAPQASRHAQRGASSKVHTETDESDLEGFEGHLGFESGTASRSLQARTLQGGPGLGEGAQIRVEKDDVIPEPIIPTGSQLSHGFSMYMGTPDQTRRGNHGIRVDSDDAPAYSTIQPITPNVSEESVLPSGSGFP